MRIVSATYRLEPLIFDSLYSWGAETLSIFSACRQRHDRCKYRMELIHKNIRLAYLHYIFNTNPS